MRWWFLWFRKGTQLLQLAVVKGAILYTKIKVDADDCWEEDYWETGIDEDAFEEKEGGI